MTETNDKVVTNHLNEREQAAYEEHARHNNPPLSPSLEAELFQLYLNGIGLEDIVRLNKGLRLGAVARAAVEGNWYERRRAYADSLLGSVVPRVQQVQAEAIVFAADLLAAAHRLHGEKIRKFLQTGDEAELGDFAVRSIDQYRKGVELLLKMTGQDGGGGGKGKKRQADEDGDDATTKDVPPASTPKPVAPGSDTITLPARALVPQEAQALLAAFEDEE
jgi:hypothetical protein